MRHPWINSIRYVRLPYLLWKMKINFRVNQTKRELQRPYTENLKFGK